MKYCPKCGAQNQDENYVCNQCRASLSNQDSYANFNLVLKNRICLFGLISGIASIALGVITFLMLIPNTEAYYSLGMEMGSSGSMMLDFITAPTRITAFPLGCLLIVIGVFIILYFKRKQLNGSDY